MLKDLWRLREFCAEGSMAQQVRDAVSNWIKSREEKFGCPIEDIAEATERHKRESKANQDDWRIKLESQVQDRSRRLSKKLY